MLTRWGIISAGSISHDFVTALATLPQHEHKVVAVAARDLKRAQEFAELQNIPKAYDSYKKIAENPDVDVVYIGSVNTQHYPQCRLMLEAGKPVLCEKPLTVNYRLTKELTDLACKKQLFLMEAVWSRCFPVYDLLREEIKSGSLGEIKQVIATLGLSMDNADRPLKRELGRGSILDVGIYVLQLVEMIYGPVMPEEVRCVGHLNVEGVDLNSAAVMKYKDGNVAFVSSNNTITLPNEAFIIGTKGSVKLHSPFWCPTTVTTPTKTSEFVLPSASHPLFHVNSTGLRYEAMEVRRCLQEGLLQSPKMTHADSLIIAQLEDKLRSILGVHYIEDNPDYKI